MALLRASWSLQICVMQRAFAVLAAPAGLRMIALCPYPSRNDPLSS
jgi:hypothetical protein